MTDAILSAFSTIGQSAALEIVVKVTAVLAAGLLLARVAERRAASIRHLIVASTFAAALVLPAVVLTAPRIDLPVPVLSPVVPGVVVAPVTTSAPGASTPARVPVAANNKAMPSILTRGIVLTGVWMSGAAAVLLWLVFHLWKLGRLRREAVPCPAMETSFAALLGERGVSRRVHLLFAREVEGPLTFGFFQPAILLPEKARDWNAAELRRALIHEMEHVRRLDFVVQVIARAIAALYWFHPLVWVAFRQLSLDAERASDDAVIEGEAGADYAEQLVSLARSMTKGSVCPAVGMARRSDLATRVHAVLRADQARGQASAFACSLAGLAVLVTVLGIGPVRAAGQAVTQPASLRQGTAVDQQLFEAAEDGNVSEVERLLAAGANANAELRGDGSPLIAAAREGRDKVVELLLNRGADPNLGVQGDGSPLIVAAEAGHLSTVQLLVQRGADVNKPVPGDGNPLIMAARGGSVQVIEFLLSRGANIEQVVAGDENALIEASASGQLAAAKLLVQRGANVNARVWSGQQGDRNGEWRTPLSMATRNGHRNVVEFLRSVGARE